MRRSAKIFMVSFFGVLILSHLTFSWIAPKRLTWNAGQSYTPRIAAGPPGIIHVVWYDDSTGIEEIYKKHSLDAGNNWSALNRLTWMSGNSTLPEMAVDFTWGAHVVWQDNSSGNFEIYFKNSPDGIALWSSPKRLSWTSDFSISPVITVDSANIIHVFWSEKAPGNYEIMHKMSADLGTTWTPPQRLTWNSGDSQRCAVDTDSANGIYLVWDDDNPSQTDIFFKSSGNAGNNWTPMRRLTWSSGYSYSPSINFDINNILHVVWHEYMNSNYEILYKNSTDLGITWSPPKRLTWNAGLSEKAKISSDGNGDVHLVWADDTPGQYEVYYKTSTDSGTTWSAPIRLTWNGGDSFSPHASSDPTNNFHIIWEDQSFGNREVMYKRKY